MRNNTVIIILVKLPVSFRGAHGCNWCKLFILKCSHVKYILCFVTNQLLANVSCQNNESLTCTVTSTNYVWKKCKWATLKIIFYMEKEFSFQDVSNSNFEPVLHNDPCNLFDQDLFPGMTKNGFLTFINILILYVKMLSFQFFLVWLTRMKGSLLCVFVSLRWESPNYTWWGLACLLPFAYCLGKKKKCFSQYNPIHSVMWTIRLDDFQIILKKKL